MPHTDSPRLLALDVELSSAARARIAAAAPGFSLVSRAALRESPELLERAEILFTLQASPERIARSPTLRFIQTYSAGIEWLLTDEVVHKPDLRVANARGVHAQPTAEHVFGLILALVRNLHRAERQQREARWSPEPLRARLDTLADKTLGVLGLGEIGRRIAQIGAAFGMRVVGSRQPGRSRCRLLSALRRGRRRSR